MLVWSGQFLAKPQIVLRSPKKSKRISHMLRFSLLTSLAIISFSYFSINSWFLWNEMIIIHGRLKVWIKQKKMCFQKSFFFLFFETVLLGCKIKQGLMYVFLILVTLHDGKTILMPFPNIANTTGDMMHACIFLLNIKYVLWV